MKVKSLPIRGGVVVNAVACRSKVPGSISHWGIFPDRPPTENWVLGKIKVARTGAVPLSQTL